VEVGAGVGGAVGVGEGAGVADGVGEGAGVADGVEEGAGVADGVGVGVADGVGVGVADGVGVGAASGSSAEPSTKTGPGGTGCAPSLCARAAAGARSTRAVSDRIIAGSPRTHSCRDR
jgi:hypothetical protein